MMPHKERLSDVAGGDMWSLQLPYALCRPLANARYMNTHTLSRSKNANSCQALRDRGAEQLFVQFLNMLTYTQ